MLDQNLVPLSQSLDLLPLFLNLVPKSCDLINLLLILVLKLSSELLKLLLIQLILATLFVKSLLDLAHVHSDSLLIALHLSFTLCLEQSLFIAHTLTFLRDTLLVKLECSLELLELGLESEILFSLFIERLELVVFVSNLVLLTDFNLLKLGPDLIESL